eukprot:scaffold58627_cov64-Phaeocystis_antarctica.AAC.1
MWATGPCRRPRRAGGPHRKNDTPSSRKADTPSRPSVDIHASRPSRPKCAAASMECQPTW